MLISISELMHIKYKINDFSNITLCIYFNNNKKHYVSTCHKQINPITH